MTNSIASRRKSQPRTRFDDTRRRMIIAIPIGVVVIATIAAVLMLMADRDPNFALGMQLGGFSRAQNVQPRNFRLWAVLPDGRLRYATLFFPASANAPASEVLTIAGPLVNSPDDIVETRYFGALNIRSEIQSGTGGDKSRFYRAFWVEHDPKSGSYGVDVVTQKSPYISKDTADKSGKMSYIAMGAPPQAYYTQVIVAVAFPPGTTIGNLMLPVATTGNTPEALMRPYRRTEVDGWTVLYFDQTSLPTTETVRVQFMPTTSKTAPDLSLWNADKAR